MPEIALLSQETIDQIAAGEVIERPSSVVKELIENAIDAKATAITVEIKDGGTSLIRITDNGCGMSKEQVPIAFLRHSTSKIKSVEDLMCVSSLGFRGEALSSIAAVAQVELITKTLDELTGTRYVIEGSKEKEKEEIGAPDGTTFLVRNLFFNTPARRKFLKTPQTEGGYIHDLVERLALSHPEISFKFINNGQTKLHTSGNSNQKDLIYHIYGREIAAALLPVQIETEFYRLEGFIGKPLISRGNRNLENYFINGRYIKSALISKALEEAYKGYLMQHQYPFCVLHFTINSEKLDVNVHPTKMELRFENQENFYHSLYEQIRMTLSHKDFIPEVSVEQEKKEIPPLPQKTVQIPEPFEKKRWNDFHIAVEPITLAQPLAYGQKEPEEKNIISSPLPSKQSDVLDIAEKKTQTFEQQTLEQLDNEFLTETARKKHKMIGQLFDTYWLIEYEEKLFIIDQHAAHEKVLYERTMEKVRQKQFHSQTISPPIVLSLSPQEIERLERFGDVFSTLGYQIEPFGGKEYLISGMPSEFSEIDTKAMFLEMLEDVTTLTGKEAPNLILEKVASMSCKAAVKGNQHLSREEMDQLVSELLQLENPYHCPHGRPTIISMTKYEIEKKFKRIL